MLEWLDSLIVFPAEYLFIKYIVVGVLLVVCVSLAYGFMTSTFSAIFNRR